MIKSDYLKDSDVRSLIKFLTGSWTAFPNGYSHTYAIPNRGRSATWLRWRTDNGFDINPQYNSLQQARGEYWWGKGAYADNTATLTILEDALRNALTARDSAALENSIFQVFDWGGVSREGNPRDENRPWVRRHRIAGTLITQINAGINYLSQDDTAFSEREFDGMGLRMNASFTKVYSLLINGFPMYDGRVGAALGLMVRLWAETNDKPSIPASLNFPWGAGQGNNPRNRDPSSTPYTFLELESHAPHAYWNMLAGWILSEVATNLDDVQLRDLEAALFMIGYEV